jgi:hypothetical protein
MSNLSDKILDQIKDRNITPKPRWQFLLHNYTIWGVAVLSVIIGSLSFSVVLYKVLYDGSHALPQGISSMAYKLQTLPLLWLVMLTLFIAIVIYNIRHTKNGYAYQPLTMLFASIAVSMALGTGMHACGISQKFDDGFLQKFPQAHKIIDRQSSYWSNPEEGRLFGVVKEVQSDTLFILDAQGDLWRVDTTDATNKYGVTIRMSIPVRVTGEAQPERLFIAQTVDPLRKPKNISQEIFQSGMPAR